LATVAKIYDWMIKFWRQLPKQPEVAEIANACEKLVPKWSI